MLRAAVFDMDGLLIDSEPLWQDAEIEVFAGVGVGLTRADCTRTRGLRVDDTIAYWLEQRPWRGVSPEEVEARLLRRVIELIGERGRPKPGVRHALDFFRTKGLGLALASSSPPPVIRAVLGRLGLVRDFDVVHSALEERRGKPDPAVYLTTAARLGVEPRQCVAFEDSPPGVLAAHAAGMRCVAVPDDCSGDPARDLETRRALAGADLVLLSLEALDEAAWCRLVG